MNNIATWQKAFKSTVPEGVSGDMAVERFSISKEDLFLASLSFGSRTPRTGDYTRLVQKSLFSGVWMSDTDAEFYDHTPLFRSAAGDVLINGLGLGCCVSVIMGNGNVSSVTVVESSSDVIALVGPHLSGLFGSRLKIVHADAFEFARQRGLRFDVIWHDIWKDICTDNLEQIAKLKRSYARRCGWQGAWVEETLRYERRSCR